MCKQIVGIGKGAHGDRWNWSGHILEKWCACGVLFTNTLFCEYVKFGRSWLFHIHFLGRYKTPCYSSEMKCMFQILSSREYCIGTQLTFMKLPSTAHCLDLMSTKSLMMLRGRWIAKTDWGELYFPGALLTVEIWLQFELLLKYASVVTSRIGHLLLLSQEQAGSCIVLHIRNCCFFWLCSSGFSGIQCVNYLNISCLHLAL